MPVRMGLLYSPIWSDGLLHVIKYHAIKHVSCITVIDNVYWNLSYDRGK